MQNNNYPKLHNATWPGIVGKGANSEPVISFDQMLQMTAAAEVDSVKFDGIDIGLLNPHFDIDMSDDAITQLAEKVSSLNLNIGSIVAPVWNGSALSTGKERTTFIDMVKKACNIGQKLKELGVRPYGVIRIYSSTNPQSWETDPVNNTKIIAETFREACDIAAKYGEKLAAEGEICWVVCIAGKR